MVVVGGRRKEEERKKGRLVGMCTQEKGERLGGDSEGKQKGVCGYQGLGRMKDGKGWLVSRIPSVDSPTILRPSLAVSHTSSYDPPSLHFPLSLFLPFTTFTPAVLRPSHSPAHSPPEPVLSPGHSLTLSASFFTPHSSYQPRLSLAHSSYRTRVLAHSLALKASFVRTRCYPKPGRPTTSPSRP